MNGDDVDVPLPLMGNLSGFGEGVSVGRQANLPFISVWFVCFLPAHDTNFGQVTFFLWFWRSFSSVESDGVIHGELLWVSSGSVEVIRAVNFTLTLQASK